MKLFSDRTKTTVMAFALMGLLVLQYQNCSNYQDPSPFDIGSNSSASTSTPSEAKLDSPVGVLDLSMYDLSLSVGGECNIGLSAKHYVEVQLLDVNNQPIPVREDTLCPKDGTNLDAACYRATQFRCEHGRYSILLPVSCAAYRYQSQSTYRLKGQLVTYNASGAEVRDTKASFERFFQIAWATNSCP